MRQTSLLMILIALFCAIPTVAQADVSPALQETALPAIGIDMPYDGQAVQGLVIVQGTSAIDGYISSNVAFTYHSDPTGTWFLITESEIPVINGALATWDTTTISDGTYDLRLLVSQADGSEIVSLIEGVRVRNYSPVETDTPAPPTPTAPLLSPTPAQALSTDVSAVPIATLTSTALRLTATPLPTNPSELSQTAILRTLSKGGLAALGLFALLGSYLAGRALLNRPTRQRRG